MRIPLSIRFPSLFAIVTQRVVKILGEFMEYLDERMLGTRCSYLYYMEDFVCIEGTYNCYLLAVIIPMGIMSIVCFGKACLMSTNLCYLNKMCIFT
jgi:hypothetical protein